jgi:protocatechuate 3,4-dioxygenase beta subunit
MKELVKIACSGFLLFCLAMVVWSQSKEVSNRSGTISGRVTYDGKPMAGVTVALFEGLSPISDQKAMAKTVTDSEGRFELVNVAAGTYRAKPVTPDFFVPHEHPELFDMGKVVNVGVGEKVSAVEFALQRGAVITGRVLDGNNQPIVEERVHVVFVSERSYQHLRFQNSAMAMTDDRGSYRIYGLPAGKYQISVGTTRWQLAMAAKSSRRVFKATYYPSVTDEKQARLIELKEGEEAKNIDISVVGETLKTFKVSGRVIDGETGNPIEGLSCVYKNGDFPTVMPVIGVSQQPTNGRGEFLIEGVLQGRYTGSIQSHSNFYSDNLNFEVKDSDVRDLEIKVHRGAVIKGKVIIEGKNNQDDLASLFPISIFAQSDDHILLTDDATQTAIEPDGSFQLSGVPPGNMKIRATNNLKEKKLWLLYVEHKGKNISEGLNVKSGDEISDVIIVAASGAGVIRGEVQLKNGDWDKISEAAVIALPKTKYGVLMVANMANIMPVGKDGRFFLAGVPPGEYVVILNLEVYMQPDREAMQMVTVTRGKDAQATFLVDLKPAEKDKDKDR